MTVALEAMCTGRPVVISKTPGIDDYVLNDTTGTVFECGDAAGMAAAIIEYLTDDSCSAEVGVAAAEHVRKHHRLDIMTDTLRVLTDKQR